jgi:hypothetical protein
MAQTIDSGEKQKHFFGIANIECPDLKLILMDLVSGETVTLLEPEERLNEDETQIQDITVIADSIYYLKVTTNTDLIERM